MYLTFLYVEGQNLALYTGFIFLKNFFVQEEQYFCQFPIYSRCFGSSVVYIILITTF